MGYRKVGYLEQIWYMVRYKIKQIWNDLKQKQKGTEQNDCK